MKIKIGGLVERLRELARIRHAPETKLAKTFAHHLTKVVAALKAAMEVKQ